jgi:hypothetical protein
MHVNMHCRVIDQQLGIDRGSTRVAVEICQMGTDAAQIVEPGNGSQQVILGEMIAQARTRRTAPVAPPAEVPSSSILPPVGRIESAQDTSIKHEFFNKINRFLKNSLSKR